MATLNVMMGIAAGGHSTLSRVVNICNLKENFAFRQTSETKPPP